MATTGNVERTKLVEALPRLRGKNLACFCAPGKPCHADVLIEMANAPVSAVHEALPSTAQAPATQGFVVQDFATQVAQGAAALLAAVDLLGAALSAPLAGSAELRADEAPPAAKSTR